tara:strand:- start:384 stop:848 length:465 start_codon:yes stop_codon:yes gene_type:complete
MIPSSPENCLLLLSSALEFTEKQNVKMNKLIIDAANKDIFFMIINNSNIYSISHENSKTNYEKLMILINDFLSSKNLKIKDISTFYLNIGPGSFAGIRNSISTIKAIHLVMKIDYYCYSFQYFKGIKEIKYENIPNLCDKFNVKKNLIKPIYIS